jgi:hypothetical protein
VPEDTIQYTAPIYVLSDMKPLAFKATVPVVVMLELNPTYTVVVFVDGAVRRKLRRVEFCAKASVGVALHVTAVVVPTVPSGATDNPNTRDGKRRKPTTTNKRLTRINFSPYFGASIEIYAGV